MVECLLPFQFLQPLDGRFSCDSGSDTIGSAAPSARTPQVVFSFWFCLKRSKCTLPADFGRRHHFSERGTIVGPIFTYNCNFLGAFNHVAGKQVWAQRDKWTPLKAALSFSFSWCVFQKCLLQPSAECHVHNFLILGDSINWKVNNKYNQYNTTNTGNV